MLNLHELLRIIDNIQYLIGAVKIVIKKNSDFFFFFKKKMVLN
jgi:hypothetical protein